GSSYFRPGRGVLLRSALGFRSSAALLRSSSSVRRGRLLRAVLGLRRRVRSSARFSAGLGPLLRLRLFGGALLRLVGAVVLPRGLAVLLRGGALRLLRVSRFLRLLLRPGGFGFRLLGVLPLLAGLLRCAPFRLLGRFGLLRLGGHLLDRRTRPLGSSGVGLFPLFSSRSLGVRVRLLGWTGAVLRGPGVRLFASRGLRLGFPVARRFGGARLRVAGPALLGGLGLLLLSGVGVGGFCGAGRTGLRALLLGVGRLGPLLGPVLLGGLLRWPAGVVRVGGRCCPGVRSLSGRSICAGLYLVELLFGAALVGVALGGLTALLRALVLVGVPLLGLLRGVLPFGVRFCGGSRLLLRCGGVRAVFGSAVGRLRRGGFRARGGPVRVLH